MTVFLPQLAAKQRDGGISTAGAANVTIHSSPSVTSPGVILIIVISIPNAHADIR